MTIVSDILTKKDSGYGVIYTGQYYDLAGVQTVIKLYKNGFSGTSTDLILGESPLVIKQLGDGDEISKAVKGSEATLNIVSTENFTLYNILLDAGVYDLRMDIEKGDALYWRGWVVADIYQESFVSPPFIVSLKAVDGLALLVNYDFVYNGTETPPYEIVPLITLLSWILSRTFLGLDIEDATGLVPDTTSGDSPLSDISIETTQLWGITLSDILEYVLSPNYRIIQANGRWVVYNPGNVVKPFNSIVYTYDLSSNSLESDKDIIYDSVPISEAGDKKCTFVDQSGIISYLGAVRNLTVKINHSLRKSIIGLSDFDDWEWAAGALVTWTITNPDPGTLSYSKYYDTVIKSNVVKIVDTDPTDGNVLTMGIYSIYDITDTKQFLKINFHWRFEGEGSFSSVNDYGIYFRIYIGSYYLQDDGTWDTVNPLLFVSRQGYGFHESMIASKEHFPTTGSLRVEIMSGVELGSNSLTKITTYLDYVYVTLNKDVDEPNRMMDESNEYESDVTTVIPLNTNSQKDALIQANWSEGLQTYDDYKNIYQDFAITGSTVITGFSSGGGYYPMAQIIKMFYAKQFRYARLKLTGIFRGNLAFFSVLRDKWLNNRLLLTNSLELDDKNCLWNGEFIEIVEGYFFIKINQRVVDFDKIVLQGTAGASIYIYWGDGSIENAILTGGTDNIYHTYVDGIYTIGLSGDVRLLTLFNAENSAVIEIFMESVPSALTDLYFNGNDLTTFDFSYLPETLERLYLNNNQITDVSGVNSATALEYFTLESNLLTSFDLTILSTPGLLIGQINLSDNQITELIGDIPGGVMVLYADDNALTTVTLTGGGALIDISFKNNAITSCESLLALLVNKGNYYGYIDLTGGSNQAKLSMTVQGQADFATLVARGWTVLMN